MITDYAKRIRAEAYCHHIRQVAQRKRDAEELIRGLTTEAGSAAGISEHVTTSPSMDAIPNMVARLQDAADKYAADLNAYVQEIDRFCRAINNLTPPGGILLFYRYVELLDCETVATKLNYSVRNVNNLKQKAMVELYATMPTNWRLWGVDVAATD